MTFRAGRPLVLALFFTMGACTRNPPNFPTKPIELKYYGAGTWAVSKGHACCDSLNHTFDLYYPTNLGANGFHHPILTWGNGSNAVPSQYDYLLTHMASWGFVVIATEDKTTGNGQTILDGANYLVGQNNGPPSNNIFYQKLDVHRIGAFGHSQGSQGAINALIKSAGLIKTVIPIELPATIWCSLGPSCADTSQLTSGSVFFIDGSTDIPISPPTQDPNIQGQQSIQAFYNAVPNATLKVRGTLMGPNHNDVQGQPDCLHASFPCVNGVYGYLGYPTAWFMFQLQGDAYAHGAFVNGTGEMFSETTNWEYVGSNIP